MQLQTCRYDLKASITSAHYVAQNTLKRSPFGHLDGLLGIFSHRTFRFTLAAIRACVFPTPQFFVPQIIICLMQCDSFFSDRAFQFHV